MHFRNLSSESNILDWIHGSAAECQASYPMLQKKLPVAVDIGANVGGFCINAYPHFDKIYNQYQRQKILYIVLVLMKLY